MQGPFQGYLGSLGSGVKDQGANDSRVGGWSIVSGHEGHVKDKKDISNLTPIVQYLQSRDDLYYKYT